MRCLWIAVLAWSLAACATTPSSACCGACATKKAQKKKSCCAGKNGTAGCKGCATKSAGQSSRTGDDVSVNPSKAAQQAVQSLLLHGY